MPSYPPSVKIVEVGPRDGLQNEAAFLDTETKIAFINRLSETGLPVIEATAFVHPERVPQLVDAEEVFRRIQKHPGVAYPVLVPNLKGLERALAVGVSEIAVFTAVSETFTQKNIHCSITESLERFKPVMEKASEKSLRVRGYISCCLGCPYEGKVDPQKVAVLARQLVEIGCAEISLGDTIGVGTPLEARAMLAAVAGEVPMERLAVHFHDTRGQALANIFACLDLGIATVDASVAGLGGCPYAPGAGGNVATEDVVYMLNGMGIGTGVDLAKLIEVGRFISQRLGRENQSRIGRVGV